MCVFSGTGPRYKMFRYRYKMSRMTTININLGLDLHIYICLEVSKTCSNFSLFLSLSLSLTHSQPHPHTHALSLNLSFIFPIQANKFQLIISPFCSLLYIDFLRIYFFLSRGIVSKDCWWSIFKRAETKQKIWMAIRNWRDDK